jgi:hypothetical protein
MTIENIGLRKLKIDANIEAIHIFNYIASKYPKLWKELITTLEVDLIYTNLVQKHKDDCLDKVRVREAIEFVENNSDCDMQTIKAIKKKLGITEK